VDGAAKVALPWQDRGTNLFGGADPIGQTIRIKQVPFTVAGAYAKGSGPRARIRTM